MLADITSRKQGAIGLGSAIAYFSAIGWSVLLPIAETQRYDLVVDSGRELLRVEVKTTTYHKNGIFCCHLTTNEGNQSWSGKRAKLSIDECDLVFILTATGDRYVFPIEELQGKASVNLGKKYEHYRL